MTTPGQLTLELSEEAVPGHEFIRFRAEYRMSSAPVLVKPSAARHQRRFVIA
jgi:hypothetical protein